MNFLYDIGRVLLDFDFERSLKALLPPGAHDPAEALAPLLERKDEFEAGRIPEDEYVAWALATLGSPLGEDEFRHAWRDIFTPNEPMWETVERLAAEGHRLILFSNTNSIHCPWIFEAFPRFSVFHGAVLSFEAGEIKPRPAIYRHALESHDLDPAATLYIDDLPENIATGESFGLRSWRYDLNDHPAFERWLARELERGSA